MDEEIMTLASHPVLTEAVLPALGLAVDVALLYLLFWM